jgi:hypothetical protein
MKSAIAAACLAAVLVASGAHADPTPLNLDWRTFLDAPNQDTFDKVYSDVKGCTDHDACIHPSRPTIQDADRLTVLMAQNNVLAVRLAIASYALLSENSTAYDDVQPSYGPFIRAFPRRYLRLAHDEGMPDAAVAAAAAATPDLMNDDFAKQLKELTARRAALRRVKDADLVAARDLCLTSIDHMVAALTPPQHATGKPLPARQKKA